MKSITFHKSPMMVGQKFWFLKPELLDYQQKTINKPSYGFDRFLPVVKWSFPRSILEPSKFLAPQHESLLEFLKSLLQIFSVGYPWHHGFTHNIDSTVLEPDSTKLPLLYL